MNARITQVEQDALRFARAALESRDTAYGIPDAIVRALSAKGLLAGPEVGGDAITLRADGTLTPGAYVRMRAALGVLHAARREHGDGVVPLIQALEAAGVLQGPENAAELLDYRANIGQLQNALIESNAKLGALEAERNTDLPQLQANLAGWAERCHLAESERDQLRIRNAELEAAAAAGPESTWFLAENEGGLPTLHATLDAAQAWGVAEIAAEHPDRPMDWYEEDGLHLLRFVHPDDDRPLHRTTVTVLPLTVQGGAA